MSEQVEVMDPTANVNWPECFGHYDDAYTDCTRVCELNTRCKAHTEAAAKKKAAPPAPEKTEVEELPDMEPKDYLVEMLKGRYDAMSKDTERGFMAAARKDGKTVIKVMIVPSGKTLIEVVPTNVKVQLDKLESCRQVMHLFKAVMVV